MGNVKNSSFLFASLDLARLLEQSGGGGYVDASRRAVEWCLPSRLFRCRILFTLGMLATLAVQGSLYLR